MAYYSTITTRYDDVYTKASDNFDAIVTANAGLSYTAAAQGTRAVTVGTTNAAVSLDTDMIVFDRTINLNGKFNGSNSNDGAHAYFVNCVFTNFSGITINSGGTRRPFIGPETTDFNDQRVAAIPSAKGSGSGWHFYNCTFILGADGSDQLLGVVGDFIDCTVSVFDPDIGQFSLFPQGDAIVRNPIANFQVIDDAQVDNNDGNINGGDFFQLFAVPRELTGVQLAGQYLYPQGNNHFNVPFYSANNEFQFGGSPLAPVIRNSSFPNPPNNTVTVLPSPQVDIQQNGQIWWRGADSQQRNVTRIIASRRFESNQFTDPSLSTNRADTKYHFITNVGYTDAGDALTITKLATDTEYSYVTNSDGVPEGTFDFEYGNVAASDTEFAAIDVPISFFYADTDSGDDFTSIRTNLSTTLETISWSGTANSSVTYDSDNWATNDSEAVVNDGYWIPRDQRTGVDAEDEFLVNYATPSVAAAIPGVANSISPNDVYAIFKYGVWLKDPDKVITIADYPYSAVGSDNVFDMSTREVNDLLLSSTNSISVFDINGSELQIPAGQFQNKDNDVVTGLKVRNLNMGGKRLEGGIIETTGSLNTMRQYASLPADVNDDFSIKDATLGGFVEPRALKSQTQRTAIFNNVRFQSGTTLQLSPSSDTDVTVYFVGGTSTANLTVNDNIANLFGLVEYTLNFDTDISSEDDIHSSVLLSSDGSTFTAVDPIDTTIASDNRSAVIRYSFDLKNSDNELYAAFNVKYHNAVRTVGTVNHTFDLTRTNQNLANGVNEDYTPTSGSDEELLLDNPFEVAGVASATANIVGQSGLTSKAITANSQASRLALRRMEQDDGWLEAVAKGFIPPNFFRWDELTVTIPDDDEADRLVVTRNASDFVWILNTRVEDLVGNSYYATISSDVPDQYISFAPSTNGASIASIQERLDRLETSIKGADDVDLSQAQEDISTASLGIPVTDR